MKFSPGAILLTPNKKILRTMACILSCWRAAFVMDPATVNFPSALQMSKAKILA